MNIPPLTEKDFDAFVKLLDAPPKFNARLAELFRSTCRACFGNLDAEGHEHGCGNGFRCEFCGLWFNADNELVDHQEEDCEPPEQEPDDEWNLFGDPDFQMDSRRDRDMGLW